MSFITLRCFVYRPSWACAGTAENSGSSLRRDLHTDLPEQFTANVGIAPPQNIIEHPTASISVRRLGLSPSIIADTFFISGVVECWSRGALDCLRSVTHYSNTPGLQRTPAPSGSHQDRRCDPDRQSSRVLLPKEIIVSPSTLPYYAIFGGPERSGIEESRAWPKSEIPRQTRDDIGVIYVYPGHHNGIFYDGAGKLRVQGKRNNKSGGAS